MITFGRSYKVGDRVFSTLAEAQADALSGVLAPDLGPDGITETANALLRHRDDVVNILTMKDNSLPRARKANGGTKRRPAKVAQATEAA